MKSTLVILLFFWSWLCIEYTQCTTIPRKPSVNVSAITNTSPETLQTKQDSVIVVEMEKQLSIVEQELNDKRTELKTLQGQQPRPKARAAVYRQTFASPH